MQWYDNDNYYVLYNSVFLIMIVVHSHIAQSSWKPAKHFFYLFVYSKLKFDDFDGPYMVSGFRDFSNSVCSNLSLCRIISNGASILFLAHMLHSEENNVKYKK